MTSIMLICKGLLASLLHLSLFPNEAGLLNRQFLLESIFLGCPAKSKKNGLKKRRTFRDTNIAQLILNFSDALQQEV